MVSIDIGETDGGASIVLPSTNIVLGFQFRGRVRAGEDHLAWPASQVFSRPRGHTRSTARTYSFEAKTGSLLVRFTPEGATCLGVPVAELTGRRVALDAILGSLASAVSSLRQQLPLRCLVLSIRTCQMNHFGKGALAEYGKNPSIGGWQ